MPDTDTPRVEDVRGEPLDELRFLTHLLLERLQDKLPPEFWEHARLARKELRAALLILLRSAVEYLTREIEEENAKDGVSAQRGKIDLDVADPTPPSTNGATPPPHPDALPPSLTNARVSPQRSKISLD